MSNLTTTIVRLAFAKGSNQIHAGLTKNGNVTLIGEIVYSEDLVISHYNREFEVNGNSVEGSVGTVCIADNEEADSLIEQIESIQSARPVNDRGNKYPFVFLRLLTDVEEGTIIFNKGLNGEKHRLTFLDVELVEVEAEAPNEVLQLDKNPNNTMSNYGSYGTVNYQTVRKLRNRQKNTTSTVVAGKAGAEGMFNPRKVNSNTVEPLDPQERLEDSKDQKIASLENELASLSLRHSEEIASMKAMMEKLLQSQKVEVEA